MERTDDASTASCVPAPASERPLNIEPEILKYLRQFTENDSDVLAVGETLNADSTRLGRFQWPGLIAALLGMLMSCLGYGELFLYYLYQHHPGHDREHGWAVSLIVGVHAADIPLAVCGTLAYLGGLAWIFMARRVYARYRCLLALIWALPMAARADGTLPLSRERRALSRQLLQCAKRSGYFGPWNPRRLDNQIIGDQADAAAQVFRRLVYPALLGDEADLRCVGEVLARAALKVGTSNWVTLRKLGTIADRFPAVPAPHRPRWSRQLDPIILAVLAAIPALPVLIAYLS
jgi:hypothetical protein